MIKKVNYKNNKAYRVYIGKNDRAQYFDTNCRNIILEFNNGTYYNELTNSFFKDCPHIDGAYLKLNVSKRSQVNILLSWLTNNKVNEVKIEVLENNVRFKITIHSFL